MRDTDRSGEAEPYLPRARLLLRYQPGTSLFLTKALCPNEIISTSNSEHIISSMNRYQPGGASQASATTTCQKCLKKGNVFHKVVPKTLANRSRTLQLRMHSVDTRDAIRVATFTKSAVLQSEVGSEFVRHSSSSRPKARDQVSWKNDVFVLPVTQLTIQSGSRSPVSPVRAAASAAEMA